LNRNWDLELAAGLRYNYFLEQPADTDQPFVFNPPVIERRRNLFHGYGGVASAELRRLVGMSSVIWTRVRGAILMDDKFIYNEDGFGGTQDARLTDVVVHQLELAFGVDYVIPRDGGGYYFLRATAEWQMWSNFSSAYDTGVDETRFDGTSDVGFGGFGFGAGLVL